MFEYHLGSLVNFLVLMMNIKIKTIAFPLLVSLSLIFGACADQTIEAPDAVDGAVQEGIEGVEQGTEDAGNAITDGVKDLEKSAEDAGNAIKDGAMDLEKNVKDGVKQGKEEAGNAIKGLEEKVPGKKSE